MAAMSFTIDVKGLNEVADRFRKGDDAVKQATHKMLDTATFIAQGMAKEKAPVDKSTLRGSITRRVEGNVGRVGTNVEYAKYQEFGTGIYNGRGMITPRRARMLAWRGKDGAMHFAKAVRGSKPRKFMQAGLLEVKAKMDTIVNVGINALKGQLGG